MKKILLTAALTLTTFAAFAAPAIHSIFVDAKTLKPTKEFTVIKAIYGAKGKTKDVTEIVKKEVKAKKDIAVNNRFGDPAPNISKKFELIYSVNGKLKLIRVNEGAVIKAATIK